MRPSIRYHREATPLRPLKRNPRPVHQPSQTRPPPSTRNVPPSTPRGPQRSIPLPPPPPSFSSFVTHSRTVALWGSLFTVTGLGYYIASLYMTYRRNSAASPFPHSSEAASQPDVSSRFDTIASTFDCDVASMEWLMGMRAKRQRLIDQARGHVLEVSVGTGRNTRFYIENFDRQEIERAKKGNKRTAGFGIVSSVTGGGSVTDQSETPQDIKSLTFVDKSREMVEFAKEKWEEESKRREEVAKQRGMTLSVPKRRREGKEEDIPIVRWVIGDAERWNGVPSPPDTTSDTVPDDQGLIDLRPATSSSNESTTSNSESTDTSSPTSILGNIRSFFTSTLATPPSITTITPITPPSDDLPTSQKYDTIIQTMGLCSTSDPIRLLQNIRHLCKSPIPTTTPSSPPTQTDSTATPTSTSTSTSPVGQILLLEHGRSHYAWLDRILDTTAPAHAERYGCWYNRDIGKIVEEACKQSKGGLECVSVRRYHLGTTWEIRLRVK